MRNGRALASWISRRARRVLHPSPGALIPIVSTPPSRLERLRRVLTLAAWRERDAHVIETERFIIRPSSPRDADGLVATIDEVVYAQHGWLPGHESSVRKAVATSTNVGQSMIVDRVSKRIVGAFGVTVDPNEKRQCDIGTWVCADMRAHGIGPEVAIAMVQRLHEMGYDTVTAATLDTNAPALRALERLGFVIDGSLVHTLDNGQHATFLVARHSRSS